MCDTSLVCYVDCLWIAGKTLICIQTHLKVVHFINDLLMSCNADIFIKKHTNIASALVPAGNERSVIVRCVLQLEQERTRLQEMLVHLKDMSGRSLQKQHQESFTMVSY